MVWFYNVKYGQPQTDISQTCIPVNSDSLNSIPINKL